MRCLMTPMANPPTLPPFLAWASAPSVKRGWMASASFSAVLASLVLVAPPALAQTAPAAGTESQSEASAAQQKTTPADGPRFSFSPTEGGALRLDTQSGMVSLCANSPTGYACTLLPDDRKAYEDQIAQLRAELAAVRAHVDAAEKDQQELDEGNLSGDQPPNPDDINAAFDYAERTLQWLRGLITGAPAKPAEESL